VAEPSRKDFFVDIDVTEGAQPDSARRRRLLGIGLGGAAVSLMPFLAGRAGATTPATGPTDSSSAATTTTAPQKRPTDADVTMLGFAQSIEIAAFQLYEVALATDVFDDNDRDVLATILEAHRAYAGSLSAFSAARHHKKSIRCSTRSNRRSEATDPASSTLRTHSSRPRWQR